LQGSCRFAHSAKHCALARHGGAAARVGLVHDSSCRQLPDAHSLGYRRARGAESPTMLALAGSCAQARIMKNRRTIEAFRRKDPAWEETAIMATHRASPGEIVDLAPLGSGLKAARTTAIVKTETFEAVRLIVHA